MKNLFLALLSFLFTTLNFAQTIEQNYSLVDFKIGSILWSKVKGDIKNMQGSVVFKENNLSNSSFDVTIDVNTIDTKNEKRDKHLKTTDFFDTDKYPTIKFKSTSITKTNDAYLTKGLLTIKDVTKEVTIPFNATKNGVHTTLIGEFEIDRLEYNIGIDQSSMLVDKNVKMTITCVLKNNL